MLLKLKENRRATSDGSLGVKLSEIVTGVDQLLVRLNITPPEDASDKDLRSLRWLEGSRSRDRHSSPFFELQNQSFDRKT